MNHKRGRPKNRRAGCIMCKPNKMNGAKSIRGMGGPHPGVAIHDRQATDRQRDQERDARAVQSWGFDPWTVDTGP